MNNSLLGFKEYEKAGVIYVMERAAEYGFDYKNRTWLNLGQGAAEVGHIKGAIDRVTQIDVDGNQHGYAPVSGLKELRENVATIYNDLFRKDKHSRYSYENVNIAGGGRMVISRIIASMGKINIGYFVPDYASYEGILSSFNNVKPTPIFLDSDSLFKYDHEKLKKEIKQKKLKALILSNPSNPTGNVILGDDLKKLISLARREKIYLIVDEFYFNFIYEEKFKLVSATEFVEDTENDFVIVISGLSKAWRYSGWRVCWAVGPKKIMDLVANVGSFLDGGANNPLQKVAIKLVTTKNILKESHSIQKHFKAKRDYMLSRLEAMGFVSNSEPGGAFYLWMNIKNLPEGINEGTKLFEELLKEKVIIVPGKFFDLNPHKRRKKSNFRHHVRFSYGPKMEVLEKGLDRVEKVVKKFKKAEV